MNDLHRMLRIAVGGYYEQGYHFSGQGWELLWIRVAFLLLLLLLLGLVVLVWVRASRAVFR